MPYLAQFNPTRSELLNLRNRLRIAIRAYNILYMKLNGLIHEVSIIAPKVKEEYDYLLLRYQRARELIIIGHMSEGAESLTLAAYAVEKRVHIDHHILNRFGVKVPEITGVNIRSDLLTRGYGLYGTSLLTDNIAETYEDLIEAIVTYSAHEVSLKLLIKEIERIRRRVKALEYMVIPQISDSIRRIVNAREELEREEHSRLFHLKKGKAN